jgi:hypothetical protein
MLASSRGVADKRGEHSGGDLMLSSQLGRTVLAGSPRSADEQDASPDDRGGYGDLMDAIDVVIREAEREAEGRPKPHRRRMEPHPPR